MGLRQILWRIARNRGYAISRVEETEGFLPGHYYSVIPSKSEIKERASEIFSRSIVLHDIEMNTDEQVKILKIFNSMENKPLFYSPERRIRFDIDNDCFSYDDAPILHYMMRHLQPKRIIEIGSGSSSACMLDTDDLFLGNSVDFTFIDIDCENLRKNLLEKDLARVRILEKPVHEVDLSIFATLKSNDILFVDSSHVLKIGSDLHTIFFEVLPVLSPGVCVHFHDIRYPFQYQEIDIMNGIFWNEAYMLRAFLSHNHDYEIMFWLNYLVNVESQDIRDLLSFLPLDGWDKRFNKSANDFSDAGGSIYITKRR